MPAGEVRSQASPAPAWRGRSALWLAGVLAGAFAAQAQAALAAPMPAGSPLITSTVTPLSVLPGQSVKISGRLSEDGGAIVGELLELQLKGARDRAFINAAHVLSGPRGAFRFPPIRVYSQTTFRVVLADRRTVAPRQLVVTIEPPRFPSSSGIRRAAAFLSARAGSTAFAVVDDRGTLSGLNVDRRFHSASVVKSMLLVACLQMLGEQGRSLDSHIRGVLYPMIHSSSNEAATETLELVGEQRLDRVAAEAHMRDYEPAGATWGFTEVSAGDLARFFYIQDRLIPARFDGYARWLLSTIEPSESWGIPAIARPEFQVFFKGGWLPEIEGLVNQVARLEGHGLRFSIAVLSTHDPSMDYGEDSIEGVTAALLGHG
jgi:hypothetical protein